MQHIFKLCRIYHLVVNLLVQLVLGLPLELVHRWWRVLIVYMAGVVAGSLGTSVTSPYTLLAGASGGVYALLLAHIATIILVRTFDHYTYLLYKLKQISLSISELITNKLLRRRWRLSLNAVGELGFSL
jgi:rhomboid-related protein 1/2/3